MVFRSDSLVDFARIGTLRRPAAHRTPPRKSGIRPFPFLHFHLRTNGSRWPAGGSLLVFFTRGAPESWAGAPSSDCRPPQQPL
jgi:hypothetical protein